MTERRVRPTGRGVGTLAIGAPSAILGLWWHYPGLAGIGIALTLLAVAGYASVARAPRVTPTRSVRPRTVQRLGICTGTLELVSLGKLPVLFDGTDLVAGEPVPIDIPLLASGEKTRVEYRIPTDRRGVHRVGPLTLRRRGLAGLAESSMTVGDVVDVRVVPRVLPVRGLPSGARRGQVGADERVERGGTDLVSLREYVPGDDLRRLHWATSARTGTLMVREDADPARPHLAVLLDDRPSAYAGEAQFEDAVEVAASLVTAAVAGGHPVRLRTTSGSADVEVTDNDAGAALNALADIGLAESAATGTIPLRDLDVVTAVTGESADLPPLLLETGRAAVGAVLVVAPAAPVSAQGTVLVIRAPSAETLLRAWDTAVAR